MTKKEFVELFGTKAGIKTKVEADKLTKAFIDTLEEILVKGENVSFIGFGKFEAAAAAAKSLQLYPTLCDPIDGSPPGSPVPGILQARTLEWVSISFSNA